MSDKNEKKYSAEEAAIAVLNKIQHMYKNSIICKNNSSHELEPGEEPNNDDAECPDYLSESETTPLGEGNKKKKKAQSSEQFEDEEYQENQPEHEKDMNEEEDAVHDEQEQDDDEQDSDKVEADEEKDEYDQDADEIVENAASDKKGEKKKENPFAKSENDIEKTNKFDSKLSPKGKKDRRATGSKFSKPLKGERGVHNPSPNSPGESNMGYLARQGTKLQREHGSLKNKIMDKLKPKWDRSLHDTGKDKINGEYGAKASSKRTRAEQKQIKPDLPKSEKGMGKSEEGMGKSDEDIAKFCKYCGSAKEHEAHQQGEKMDLKKPSKLGGFLDRKQEKNKKMEKMLGIQEKQDKQGLQEKAPVQEKPSGMKGY